MLPTLVEQYRRWFGYEHESHRAVMATLDAVPEDGRGSESFQKALRILGHVIAARRVWLHRIDPSNPRPAELFPVNVSLDGLRAELAAMEQGWSAYYERMDERELARVIEYKSIDAGWFRSAITDVLTQLHGHSLYHRGQIASLVRACGVEPAITDFIFWSRESIPAPAANPT